MDKKTIIGLVLMVAVFVGFAFYQSHEAEKYAEYRKELAKQQQEQMARTYEMLQKVQQDQNSVAQGDSIVDQPKTVN